MYGICGTCEGLKKVRYSDHEVQCLRDLFILYLFGLNRIKANNTGTIFFLIPSGSDCGSHASQCIEFFSVKKSKEPFKACNIFISSLATCCV